jgi:hypothetical protein
VNDSCAPGCGRSRRQISLIPSGQADRSTRPVSSHTWPFSRTPSSWSSPHPRVLGDFEDRLADRFGEVVAERQLDPRVPAPVGELGRGAGRIRAQQDLDLLDVLVGDLRERQVTDRDLVGRGVSACVPGAQTAAERLPGLIQVDLQRVKPVAALVVPGRLLLLRMRRDQRRVNIERQPLRSTVQFPEPLAGADVRDTDRFQQPWRGRDPVDHPKRGRVRRDRPEQRLLLTDRAEVRDTFAAVGEHHREIADHPARVMTATPLLDRRQPQRQRLREPDLVRHLRDQRGARVRDQPRSVRRDFYGYRASITHHL